MTETPQGSIQGRLFLYEQPEVLTREAHQNLGVSPSSAPYAYAKDVQAVPLTLAEFTTAQKFYPIVFASLENPVPLAVLGVLEDHNLFLNSRSEWEPLAYIPAYLRCHPFTFARHGENQMTVVIDRAAATISQTPEHPFFEGEEASAYTKEMTQLCMRYQAESERTEKQCRQLLENKLLVGQHVTYAAEEGAEPQVLANYVSIDTERLNQLNRDEVFDLYKSGLLAGIYAQINSMDNWTALLTRRTVRLG